MLAVAGSRVSHKNLVAVIDFGEDNGAPFLVMECVRGTLLGRLDRLSFVARSEVRG